MKKGIEEFNDIIALGETTEGRNDTDWCGTGMNDYDMV